MYKSLVYMASLLSMVALSPAVSAAEPAAVPQTSIGGGAPVQKSPLVVIYTLSTCPHCMEAKEYLTRNNIPHVVREVDSDEQHMQELMQIYDQMNVASEKRGVPLLIIGGSIRLQGFNKEKVQDALKKVQKK